MGICNENVPAFAMEIVKADGLPSESRWVASVVANKVENLAKDKHMGLSALRIELI